MKKVLIISAILFGSIASNAQHWRFLRNEVFFGIGASNFLGELGGADQIGSNGLRDLEFRMTRYTFSGGYRFIASPKFGIRANLTISRVDGDDALTEEPSRSARQLSFKSPIYELAGIVEYYPFGEKLDHLYRMKGAEGDKLSLLSPYIFTGIAGFYFNPKGQYNGEWYALQPLRTEGQGLAPDRPEQYRRVSFAIPVGIGVKYALSNQWSIGFEISGRKTFTDYIDDVSTTYYYPDEIRTAAENAGLNGDAAAYLSDPNEGANGYTGVIGNQNGSNFLQRGDDTDNDAYMFAIFSVHYRFLKGRSNLPKF